MLIAFHLFDYVFTLNFFFFLNKKNHRLQVITVGERCGVCVCVCGGGGLERERGS